MVTSDLHRGGRVSIASQGKNQAGGIYNSTCGEVVASNIYFLRKHSTADCT